MTPKQHVVRMLLLAYPLAWRREYGPELGAMLTARPLTGWIVINVLWSGLKERARVPEPFVILGTLAMLLMLTRLIWNIVYPSFDAYSWTALIQPSGITFPRYVLGPLMFETHAILVMVCGWWTHKLYGGALSRAGWAGVKLSILAGAPVIIAGVLMLFGVLGMTVLGPGDAPTSFAVHGFSYTYYTGRAPAPHALDIIYAPISALPQAWLYAFMGAAVRRAQCTFEKRRSTAVS